VTGEWQGHSRSGPTGPAARTASARARYGIEAATALPAEVDHGGYGVPGASPQAGFANPSPPLGEGGLYTFELGDPFDGPTFAGASVTVGLGAGHSLADCPPAQHRRRARPAEGAGGNLCAPQPRPRR
jgi:hypothetical protein